jgi:hypothetical protein
MEHPLLLGTSEKGCFIHAQQRMDRLLIGTASTVRR